MTSRFYMDDKGKIILCRIHPGGSIGMHEHSTSDDVSYIISGQGKAICNGQEELLKPGICHICPKGSSHSIKNICNEDLVALTIVIER